MENIITWCSLNKEWLFSGIGVLFIGFFIKEKVSKIQKAGKSSIQISDINGNVNIKTK